MHPDCALQHLVHRLCLAFADDSMGKAAYAEPMLWHGSKYREHLCKEAVGKLVDVIYELSRSSYINLNPDDFLMYEIVKF